MDDARKDPLRGLGPRSSEWRTAPEPRDWALETHRIALVLTWTVVVGLLVVMLSQDVRYTDRYGSARYLLQAAYVAVLLWYLFRTGRSFRQLPELRPHVLTRWRYGPSIAVLGIISILALTVFSDDGIDILMLLLMVTTAWILVSWRREIRLRFAVQGLAVALVAFVGGLPALANGFIGETAFYGLLVLAPPMYMAGVVLFKRTELGGIQLSVARYGKGVRSVLWGCVMFVPLGLINAAEGSPGVDINWVTEWWMPLSLPLFSGIAEEIWFRLLMVGLCYYLLRTAFREHAVLAVFGAVLFSAITFGLSHGRTVERLLTTGLLYGLPMAVVFAKRDWEHAVGAHYMVNLIPWVVVFFES